MQILAEYQLWLSCSSSSGLSLLRPLASKQNLYRWHRLIAGHALLLQEGFWRLPASAADLQQMRRSWMRRCGRSVPRHRAMSWRTPGAKCRYMWINPLAETEGESGGRPRRHRPVAPARDKSLAFYFRQEWLIENDREKMRVWGRWRLQILPNNQEDASDLPVPPARACYLISFILPR